MRHAPVACTLVCARGQMLQQAEQMRALIEAQAAAAAATALLEQQQTDGFMTAAQFKSIAEKVGRKARGREGWNGMNKALFQKSRRLFEQWQ